MEEKKNLLTYAGLKKLEDELHDLKVVKRKEVAGKIKEAREQGDLSENAEYDAAKEEQRDIEARIEELDKILKNAEVVVEEDVSADAINIGCSVKLLDLSYNEELDYKIVGSTEANVLKGKLLMTTFDINSNLNKRIVARQLRKSILEYMSGDSFKPEITLDIKVIHDLFEKEATKVNMFTKDSPDELKPKIIR